MVRASNACSKPCASVHACPCAAPSTLPSMLPSTCPSGRRHLTNSSWAPGDIQPLSSMHTPNHATRAAARTNEAAAASPEDSPQAPTVADPALQQTPRRSSKAGGTVVWDSVEEGLYRAAVGKGGNADGGAAAQPGATPSPHWPSPHAPEPDAAERGGWADAPSAAQLEAAAAVAAAQQRAEEGGAVGAGTGKVPRALGPAALEALAALARHGRTPQEVAASLTTLEARAMQVGGGRSHRVCTAHCAQQQAPWGQKARGNACCSRACGCGSFVGAAFDGAVLASLALAQVGVEGCAKGCHRRPTWAGGGVEVGGGAQRLRAPVQANVLHVICR